MAGISGYWLVWDRLAQYVAIVSTEWLDHLPFFGQPVARNFLSPVSLENRFFTLMIFVHVAVPLIALMVLWLHLQRISRPRINPPRGLAIGAGLALVALSVANPAVSQGRANLAQVPGAIGLDWFYLGAFPLLENLVGPSDLEQRGRDPPHHGGGAVAAAAEAIPSPWSISPIATAVPVAGMTVPTAP